VVSQFPKWALLTSVARTNTAAYLRGMDGEDERWGRELQRALLARANSIDCPACGGRMAWTETRPVPNDNIERVFACPDCGKKLVARMHKDTDRAQGS